MLHLNYFLLFVLQVMVDDQTCTGVGPNKKLAKRHAAEAMLLHLGYNKPSPQPAKPAIKSATEVDRIVLLFLTRFSN